MCAGARRIVGIEHEKRAASSYKRLIYHIYLADTGELIGFLIPDEFHSSLRASDGFELSRIIGSTEDDTLSRGLIDEFGNTYATVPKIGSAETVNCPQKLLIYGFPESSADLTDCNRVGGGVSHNTANYLKAHER